MQSFFQNYESPGNIRKTIKAIIITTHLFTSRNFNSLESVSTNREAKEKQVNLFPTPSPDIKSSLATGVTYAIQEKMEEEEEDTRRDAEARKSVSR